MTVGPGLSPGLLTPHGNAGARGLVATLPFDSDHIPPVGTFTPP